MWVRDQNNDSYKYSNGYFFCYYYSASSKLFESDGSGLTTLDTGNTALDNATWERRAVKVLNDTYSEDEYSGLSASDSTYTSGGISIGKHTYVDLEIDWVLVRKCIAVEPSHGAWGSETTLSTESRAWEYRKSHRINGSNGAGLNYQIRITAHTGSGTDSGASVYLNSHAESDFSDVRFTSGNGDELLDYWCESVHSGNNATFWVEVGANLDNDQDIYVYYGFDNALNASDGHATFDWFEDFEDEDANTDPDSTHWETPVDDDGNGTYVNVVSDPAEGDQALKIYNDGDEVSTYVITKSMNLSSRDYAIGWQWYRDDDEYSYFMIRGTSGYLVVSYSGTSNEYFEFRDTSGAYQEPDPSWHEGDWDSWRRIEVRISGNSSTTGELLDLKDGTNHTIDLRKTYPGTSGYLDKFYPIYSLRYRTQTLYTDNIYVRKYVSSEPVHDSWGSEETL
jgi:hypothetical protein